MRKKKTVPALFLGLLAMYSTVVMTGCTSETVHPTDSAAPALETPAAYIAMDTQYYDVVGNIVEIPVIQGEDNPEIQAINQGLYALRDSYRSCWETPYEQVSRELVAYPTDTGRYLNLILRGSDSGYGNDGEVYTWVYDKTEHRQANTQEALAVAGVTEDGLRTELESLLAAEQVPRTLESMEIAGFRIRADGGAELYLYALVAHTVLPDEQGELDDWRRLYIRSEDRLSRYNEEYLPTLGHAFIPLVPTEEITAFSPPLWCLWGPGGGEPEGGFTQPPIPDWVTVEHCDFGDYYVLYQGELTHYSSLEDYTDAYRRTEAAGEAGQFIPLFSGNYRQTFTQGMCTSPAWPAVDALSKQILSLLTDDNAETAAGLAEQYLSSGVSAQDWDAPWETYLSYVSYTGDRLLSLLHTIELSPSDFGGGELTAAQVYDRDTGAQLAFSDLFSDPDEAAQRTADYLSGVTGLSAEQTATLLSPYHFFLVPDGRIAVFCPGWALGDAVTLDITEFLSDAEGNSYSYDTWWNAQQAAPTTLDIQNQISRFEVVGVHLVHYAVPFLLPQDLLDDLLIFS